MDTILKNKTFKKRYRWFKWLPLMCLLLSCSCPKHGTKNCIMTNITFTINSFEITETITGRITENWQYVGGDTTVSVNIIKENLTFNDRALNKNCDSLRTGSTINKYQFDLTNMSESINSVVITDEEDNNFELTLQVPLNDSQSVYANIIKTGEVQEMMASKLGFYRDTFILKDSLYNIDIDFSYSIGSSDRTSCLVITG